MIEKRNEMKGNNTQRLGRGTRRMWKYMDMLPWMQGPTNGPPTTKQGRKEVMIEKSEKEMKGRKQ